MFNNKDSNTAYELRTIEDLLTIPADRFDEFLLDLVKFVGAARSTKNLIDTIAKANGTESSPHNVITMRWTDDGKREGRVIITSSTEVKL